MKATASILLTALFVAIPVAGLAGIPDTLLPNGPHPRLWWTEGRQQQVMFSRELQTSEWLAFEIHANQYLTTIPWNGPQYALPHLALMYRITGDDIYANRAIEQMRAIPHPSEQGDVSKSHMGYFALAYDWLHSHPGMTAAVRNELINKAVEWSDYVWHEESESGLFGNGQDTDFVIGTGISHLMLGCAFYGDTGKAAEMLDRGWWMWERGLGNVTSDPRQYTDAQPIRDWIKGAVGGHFYVGMLYFANNESYMLAWYYETLRTACRYNVTEREPELAGFWGNCLRTIFDLTDPPRNHLYHTSDWQDSNAIASIAWFTRALAYLIDQAETEGSTQMAAYGRSYLNQVTDQYSNDTFATLFFDRPGAPVSNPYESNLPKVRLAQGQEFLFFRDSWGTEARWGILSGQKGQPADHQNEDTGSFSLWRQNDYLTKGPRTYPNGIDQGNLFNNLSIQNGLPRGSPRMSGFAGRASVERSLLQDGDQPLVYAMVQADNQWDPDPESWESQDYVTTYRRHFFWSGDHCVVFDRLRTATTSWSQYRLRSPTRPVPVGAAWRQVSANGQHAMIHQYLEPVGARIEIVDEKVAWQSLEDWEVNPSERNWHTLVRPPADTHTVNYLGVMEMGDSNLQSFSAMESLVTGPNSGVRLGGHVLVFSREESLRREVSYQIANGSGPLKHLVADLEAGSWRLWIDNIQQPQAITVRSGELCALFASNRPQSGPLGIRLQWAGAPEIPVPSTGSNPEGFAMAPLYRFHRKDNNSHFFTAIEDEKDGILANMSPAVWTLEGVSHRVLLTQPSGALPVYRLFNRRSGSHFYTLGEAERDEVLRNLPEVYRLEGVAFFAFAGAVEGAMPVYRFRAPRTGSHFFTISEEEKNWIIANMPSASLAFEGIAWFAYP